MWKDPLACGPCGSGSKRLAEVFVEFNEPVSAKNGAKYIARACGGESDRGQWQGWLEFVPVAGGEGEIVRSGRETTQPNRTDTEYWATGLTPVFLEGALERALNPVARVERPAVLPPIHDGPAPDFSPSLARPTAGILNPFSVYRKGERRLRSQLLALSGWHLVNIIRAHNLSTEDPATLTHMPPAALVETIVTAVRTRAGTPAP